MFSLFIYYTLMAGLGFREKIKNFFTRKQPGEDEFYEDLEDLLVEGDFGAAESYQTVDELRGICKKKGVHDTEAIRDELAAVLRAKFDAVKSTPPEIGAAGKLTVVLLLGVNGVGKTTTCAKLASLAMKQGQKPILAAADTFRAAAIDQLKIHGDRLGVRVVAHQRGGDPAAVIYDAIDAAVAAGSSLIIADTAGRMHTRSALVEELKKIDRVIINKKEASSTDIEIIRYLALDSTTGRNALAQAETFNEATPLSGVVLTKCDSTARGGAAFALADDLKLPVAWVCSGERYEDIARFDTEDYVRGFLGL
jgi:fused signal recognition particle receptor